jgi:predicted RecA/RadA family phage recombinase
MAVTYAKFKHGEPLMVDHTPGSAVSAGDVIKTNDSLRIAHSDIASGAKGALAAGGGVYEFPKTSGSTTAIADDKLVYWDATNHVITTTSSGNTKLGYTVGASVDGDTTQRVRHVVF